MMSSAAQLASVSLRPTQNSPISKPRALYSIDQILSTQHRRNNTIGKYINFVVLVPNTFHRKNDKVIAGDAVN